MAKSANESKDIRQLEHELFTSMAKVRQPFAPDIPTLSNDPQENTNDLQYDNAMAALIRDAQRFTPEQYREAEKASTRARWPMMSEEEVDYWSSL